MASIQTPARGRPPGRILFSNRIRNGNNATIFCYLSNTHKFSLSSKQLTLIHIYIFPAPMNRYNWLLFGFAGIASMAVNKYRST